MTRIYLLNKNLRSRHTSRASYQKKALSTSQQDSSVAPPELHNPNHLTAHKHNSVPSHMRLSIPERKHPVFSSNKSNLLQLQTEAAYPRGRPETQASRDIALEDLDQVERSPSSSSPSSTPDLYDLNQARCSRCQRTLSIGASSLSPANMVHFGTNLCYCARCANMVGLKS